MSDISPNQREILKVKDASSGTSFSVKGNSSDGSVYVTQTAGGGAIQDGVTSTIEATVLDYTSSNPLAVRLTDTAGDYVSAIGGTQYTEDAVAATNTVGNALIVIREDARAGGLTTADGDNVALRGNNLCELYVKHTDSIAVTGTFWQATQPISNAGITTIAGAVSGSEMQVDIVGSLPTGTNAIGKLAPNSGVDIGDIDVTSVIPGVGATNLGKAIDTATGATDTGVLALATRDDALTTLTPADGDNSQLRVDSTGRLWITHGGLDDLENGSVELTAFQGGAWTVGLISADATNLNNVDTATTAMAGSTDDTGFGLGTAVVFPAAGFYISTADTVNDGDAGAIRMSANRNLYTNIRDAAGNERGVNVNASNQLSVSVDNNPVLGAGTNGIGKLTANSGVDIGDVDVTSVIPGTAATNLGKAEDAAHS